VADIFGTSPKPRESPKRQGVKRKMVKVSAGHKRRSLPCRLNPSVIRQICEPAEKCKTSKARIMYVNSNYGSKNNADLSQTDCHEPNCPCRGPKSSKSEPGPKPKMGQSPATWDDTTVTPWCWELQKKLSRYSRTNPQSIPNLKISMDNIITSYIKSLELNVPG